MWNQTGRSADTRSRTAESDLKDVLALDNGLSLRALKRACAWKVKFDQL